MKYNLALMDVNVTRELVKCFNFAAVKHRYQRRKDVEKTPYINHPIGLLWQALIYLYILKVMFIIRILSRCSIHPY